jgi:DNA-binding transcriptional regulator GbsR (MarR family)
MKPKIRHPKLDPKKNPELKNLADLVGSFIEYWGFKSVQGRMWCYLFLIKEPLNSKQLSQLLGISAALVTQSVKVLLEYRVILEAEKGANGILRFRANPNVAEAISNVISQRETVLLEKIGVAQAQLERARPSKEVSEKLELDSDRVKQVGQWVDLACLGLQLGVLSLNKPSNPFAHPEEFKSNNLTRKLVIQPRPSRE